MIPSVIGSYLTCPCSNTLIKVTFYHIFPTFSSTVAMEQYKRQLLNKKEELKEKITEELKDKSEHVKEKIKDVQDIGTEGKIIVDLLTGSLSTNAATSDSSGQGRFSK